MTPELTALALTILLQGAQVILHNILTVREAGLRFSMGARDEGFRLSPRAGRLQRAMNNHFEGLILFTAAVALVHLSGQSSALTIACAWIYLGARVLFIPAYFLALVPWRSALWMLGFFATLAMVASTLV
jgi:uncharacterized MAPEG superfamily protein